MVPLLAGLPRVIISAKRISHRGDSTRAWCFASARARRHIMFKLCGVLHTNTTYSSLFLFLSLCTLGAPCLCLQMIPDSLLKFKTLEIHVKTSHNLKQETKCQLPIQHQAAWPVRHWAGLGRACSLIFSSSVTFTARRRSVSSPTASKTSPKIALV